MLNLKRDKQELLVYGLLWGVLFLAPIVGHFVSSDQHDQMPFEWNDVFFVWRQLALYFGVFLVHNFLLAPLLVERQRRWLYLSLVTVLLAAFTVVQCSHLPHERPDEGFHPEMDDRGHSPFDDEGMADFRPPFDEDGGMDDHRPPFDEDEAFAPDAHPEHKPLRGPKPDGGRPPMGIGQHDVVAIIMLILMLGMNIGVKLYFRQRRDRLRLAQLEKQNLEQQLEYLRYQINPHFLMNTLNNIHALVDIDAERAKESIVSLSKIMRFVLYEGSKQTVPLGRELTFTQDYIDLMRMRYDERVKISVDMPDIVPDAQIPPLVLITFLENAFKHGVSYQQESFINITVHVDDHHLRFECVNSKITQQDDHHGGVGLRNVRKRLELIYGNRYTLHIDEQPRTYNIQLVLPL